MPFLTIPTEPTKEIIDSEYCYLFIKADDPKLRKNATKEEKEVYKEDVSQRKKMFDMLACGHYDVKNSLIPLVPITEEIANYICTADSYIFKINPVNATKIYDEGGLLYEYYVSTFDVDKRIDNIYELIDDLAENELLYEKVFREIFRCYCFSERDVFSQMNIRISQIFEYAGKMHKDRKLYLSRLLPDSFILVNSPESEKQVMELLSDKRIQLFSEDDDYKEVLEKLINAYWFNIAVDYFNALPKDYDREETAELIKDEELAMRALRRNNNNPAVKQLLSLLKAEDVVIILKIYTYSSTTEKVFDNMNQLKTYVIRNYGLTFDEACKEVGEWIGSNEEWFEII